MDLDRDILETEDTLKNKYLIFSIDEVNYGIKIQYVNEIIEIEQITKVPDLPDYVKGIINLRGKVISVMDVRLRFNKEEKEYDDKTCIVIINIEDVTFGLIVDSVKEVASIDEADIAPPPTIINNEDSGSRFIEGIGKVENDNWLFIDCRKLLNERYWM